MNKTYTTLEYKTKKEEARNLRKTTDLTLNQIAEQLHINHITACNWCKDISPEKNVIKSFDPTQRISQKFGALTIIDYINWKDGYKCQCDCGNITMSRYDSLKRGDKKSCGCMKNIRHKSFDQQSFIKRAISIWGDKYDYSLVKYVNCQTRVEILCNQFKYHQLYGGNLGNRLYDFYLEQENKYIEITGYNKGNYKYMTHQHWIGYLRNIIIKKRYVEKLGAKFEFIQTKKLNTAQIRYIKSHILK